MILKEYINFMIDGQRLQKILLNLNLISEISKKLIILYLQVWEVLELLEIFFQHFFQKRIFM